MASQTESGNKFDEFEMAKKRRCFQGKIKNHSVWSDWCGQLVTPTGFEPVNAALRGLRLKPLVDGAMEQALL